MDNQSRLIEKLNQERELYTDLANLLPAGMYRLRVFAEVSTSDTHWSSSVNAPYRIEYANKRFFEILDLERDVFEKNPGIINDLIFEEDRADFVRLNIEANATKTPFNWECRLKVRDKLVWAHFESTPRTLANGDIIWTGVMYDISKRKQTELEIASKNRELTLVNAEKDKFFSIIAHDLKSPFNSILGFSELLVEEVGMRNFEMIEKFAAIIHESSNHAMGLLTNLMEWAQSHTGRMEYHPENFEIVAFIQDTILLNKDIALQKSITINSDLPDQLFVYADRAMISKVFRNIISNAIKFTMPGGAISITSVEKPDEIIFSIADTGVGIASERVSGLFSIENVSSTTGTQNEKGTGLGLLLCKELVEKQKGRIWVESEAGKGSTFYFTTKK